MTGPIEVELTPREIITVAVNAVLHQVNDIVTGDSGVNRQPEHLQWQVKIEGKLAEYAAAKALGAFWNGAHGKGGVDIHGAEVRMTRYYNGSLFLHEHDKDDRPYILVTGLNGRYRVIGWIMGHDGKQPEFWQRKSDKRPPAYFVPQEVLNDLDMLREW